MNNTFNIYCDESCHLENDRQAVMVLGAVWCPLGKAKEIAIRLREIKQRHGLPSNFETKWIKISPAKILFYRDVVDYFFDDDDLHFRALIVPDKSLLRHTKFRQTHDDWYYKMYFDMIKVLLSPEGHYRIYLDIKDTRSEEKIKKLREVLINEKQDFRREIVERIQTVRSHEVEQLQVADLLIGAISYLNRGLQSSSAKLEIINRIIHRSKYQLTRSTLPRENKFNLFRWKASEEKE
jgi:hypothetical protein